MQTAAKNFPQPGRIELALAPLDFCVTINNVTAAAFSTIEEATRYCRETNAEWRKQVAFVWQLDRSTDLCIRQPAEA